MPETNIRATSWLLLPLLAVAATMLIHPVAASAADYNLLGYEGIGTLGSATFVSGGTPPVGDFVTTHCRYIDVQNTNIGEYYLRCPLDLPDLATITGIKLFVADFNSTGVLWAYLRSRPWNSRDGGTVVDFTLTDNTTNGDKLIDMGPMAVTVYNASTEYWIDVTPVNGSNPGQLCVYGIQVTYN